MNHQLVISLRPNKASEVIGQEEIISELLSLQKRKIQLRGVLFHGPSGTGKTTLARLLACSLQVPARWLSPDQGDWENFDQGSYEVLERNSADFSGIDEVRKLIELTEYKPIYGTRVIIMDEAHKLTDAAQNALLKPVEDSPAHTVWIFCTTNVGKIIPTLRKRCLSFETVPLIDPKFQKALISRASSALPPPEKRSIKTFLELAEAQEITAPRDILAAYESWVVTGKVRHLTDDQNAEIIEACRLLLQGKSSGAFAYFKANPNAEAARTLRLVACSYLKAVLLNRPSSNLVSAINAISAPIPPEDPAAIAKIVASFFEASAYLGGSKASNRF